VTTKYNPARTWTPENAVGIGGAYLCVYGMEGPGGYQFVGRTLQMWNTFRSTPEFPPGTPWLLRFFDELRFHAVSAQELLEIRDTFPRGRYSLRVEPKQFRLRDYHSFLKSIKADAEAFKNHQQAAFEAERERWASVGQAEYMDPSGWMQSGSLADCGQCLEHRSSNRATGGGGTKTHDSRSHEDRNCSRGAEFRHHRKVELCGGSPGRSRPDSSAASL
jgi:hypothetical protein